MARVSRKFNINSPIKGNFEKLMREGKIINPFPFIGLDQETLNSSQYINLFGTALLNYTNPLEHIRIFTRSIISCTMERQPHVHSEEYDLLESVLTYLYFEASEEEQNIPMLIEVLAGELSGELPISILYYNLSKSGAQNHRAFSRFRSYNSISDEEKKKTIVSSLLKRLQPLFRIYSESLPIVPVDNIHNLATSMVMNFGVSRIFPDSFDNVAEVQVLFLEILWHYLNSLSDTERTRKRMDALLSDEINNVVQIWNMQFCKSENSCIKELLERFNGVLAMIDHDKLIALNRRIVDFYREI